MLGNKKQTNKKNQHWTGHLTWPGNAEEEEEEAEEGLIPRKTTDTKPTHHPETIYIYEEGSNTVESLFTRAAGTGERP